MEKNGKKRKFLPGLLSAVLLYSTVLAFGLALVGCADASSSSPDPLSSDPTLKSIVVAGVRSATLGVPSLNWIEAAETAGHIFVGNASLVQATVGVVGLDSRSTVYYAQAKANVQPNFVTGTKFTFADNDFLFVEVFSANRDQYIIYAVQVHKRNPGVADITLGGRSATGGKNASGSLITSFGKVGTPAASPEALTADQEGEIWFGDNEDGTTLALAVKPEDSTSTIRVATAPAGADPVFEGDFFPAFNGIVSGLTADVNNGDYLYVEVKSAYQYGGFNSHVDNGYYKFKMIAKNNDRTLTNAEIQWYEGATPKGTIPLVIGPMGTVSMTGSESYGNYVGGPELAPVPGGSPPGTISGSIATITDYVNRVGAIPADFHAELVLAPNNPDLKLEYDWIKNQRDGSLAFDKTSNLGRLVGGNWLLVQVTSELGEKGWYKFLLNAGNNSTALDSITINGTPVSIPPVNNAVTGTDKVIHTVNRDDLASLKVEVAAANGFESPIAIGLAPTLTTSLGTVVFDVNAAEGLDTFSAVKSGQIIVIRVLPENSVEFYGGSGAAPIWQDSTLPNAGSTSGTAVARYYKIFISSGSDDTGLSSITYKGSSVTVPAASSVVPVNTYNITDKKGNITVNATIGGDGFAPPYVATTYRTTDWVDAVINAVPADADATVSYAFVAGPLTEAHLATQGILNTDGTPGYLHAPQQPGTYPNTDGTFYTIELDTGIALPTASLSSSGKLETITSTGGTVYIRVVSPSALFEKWYLVHLEE